MDLRTSQYVIQVVDLATGKVVQWAPGLMVERQLVADLCNRVGAKGVGLFRGVDTVKAAVKEAWEELLYEMKSEV